MTPLHDHTEERLPLIVSLYRYRNDRYILQVITQTEGEKTVFLFARGYCACSREVSLREVLDRQYYLAGSYKSAIDRFDRACPEFHLKQYAERSPNILVPLLAADYHAGMELAARSGVPGIAENYDQLSAMDINPALYRSLKDMFGLPMSVLRALSRSQSCDLIIDRLRAVYAHNPVLVQFDSFTESMIRFYLRADIVPDGRRDAAGRRDRIRGIRQLSDRQILQILRYLKERPNIGQYYFDYLTACDQLGEYPFGITPRIPIQEAHNLTVARIMYSRDKTTESAFETEVSAEKYMDLATDQREEDEEKFKDDKYLVTVPRSGDDLFAESENMHNCVRIYVPRVAQGETRIYFLRQKKDPGKSYGTLEVSGDGEQLWQAKAFGNAPLEEDAQRFVVKWCRSKGIGISTWDIDRKFMRRT